MGKELCESRTLARSAAGAAGDSRNSLPINLHFSGNFKRLQNFLMELGGGGR